jgi:hypothetical protein
LTPEDADESAVEVELTNTMSIHMLAEDT